MRLRSTIVLTICIFLPLLVALVATTLWVLSNDRELHAEAVANGERAFVEIQAEVIGVITDGLVADLRFVASLAGSAGGPGTLESFLSDHREYDQIRYLDPDGMETLRINQSPDGPLRVPDSELQFKGDRYYFMDAHRLTPGTVYFSPLDLNVENGRIERPLKPMIRAAVAIPKEGFDDHGLAIVNYRAAVLLAEIERLSRLSSGWVSFINRDSEFMYGAPNGQNWGFMVPEAEYPSYKTLHPVAWERIARSGREWGQFPADGALYTYATIRPLARLAEHAGSSTGSFNARSAETDPVRPDDYIWYVVARSNPDALYAQLDRRRWISGAAALIGLLLAGGAYATVKVVEQNRLAAERIARLLSENETILKEVHHRIKNDMTFVSSMLAIHAQTVTSEEARESLDDASERVRVMSDIYQTLYNSDDVGSVALGSVIENVARHFVDGFSAAEMRISTSMDADVVPRRIAVPLSICAAELITNSLKYAKRGDGTPCALHLQVEITPEEVVVEVHDNGPGYPDAVVTGDGSSPGFGMLMIRSLVAQHEGVVAFENVNGARARITLPVTGPRI